MAIFSPTEITDNYMRASVGKAASPAWRLFLLAVAAGVLIGLGAVTSSTAAHGLENAGLVRLMSGLIFPVGLMMVILMGTELFTGNALMVTAAIDGQITWGRLFRNWGIVWIGNLAGSLLAMFIIFMSNLQGMNGGAVGEAFVSVAAGKVSLAPEVLFFKAILCNILVCLAVWIGFSARTVADKVLGILLPISAFVACGFEHCVANMFFLPMGLLLNSMGVGAADAVTLVGIATNLSAATLGNVAGGVAVGMAYWFVYRKKDVDR